MYKVYTPTCGTATDIVYFEVTPIPIPGQGNARGLTTCNSYTGPFGLLCDQFWVQVDPVEVFIENGGFSGSSSQLNTNLHKTIRHETGHTAGLGHSTGIDAMVSGPVPDTFSYVLYSGHDVCHINHQIAGAPLC
jgi:hypothetical protein